MSDIEIKTARESPKSFFDLTSSQIEALAQAAVSKAIAKTWEMGLPIITEVDGRICKKYSDGRIEWM